MTPDPPHQLRVVADRPLGQVTMLPVAPAMTDAGASPPRTAPLRADAVRNRRRVLDAAQRLLQRKGLQGLTMDAVATAAGVGKGTVFRRFGDRGSLLHALLDDEERQLQERVLRGPAPLGPGAPPLARLIAYGDARLDHLARHGELLAAAESAGTATMPGVQHPVALSSRLHIAHLLRQAGHGASLAAVLAGALLGFLHAGRVRELRDGEGHSHAELLAAWTALVQGAVQAAAAPAR